MQGSGVGSAQAVGGAAEFLVLPLHRSLQEYIQQERLSDVECAHCNARQDATRQMVLLELPPVLTLQVRHAIPMIVDRIFSTSTPPSPFPPTSCCPLCSCAVQLLRFVYDLGTGSKKKVNTAVKFPATIDMSRYVDGGKGADGRRSHPIISPPPP